jgi:uncharacterized protein DUF4124
MTRREQSFAALRIPIASLAAALALSFAVDAHATICKYIDADGAIHYTNVSPDRGWRKLSCEIADDTPRPKAQGVNGGTKASTPAGFPRVEPEAQRSRDELRRKLLADELATEEKLLGEARNAYGNGAPPPLAEEQSDAEKYRQRIGRLRQAVQLHERNIEALRKELAAVR